MNNKRIINKLIAMVMVVSILMGTSFLNTSYGLSSEKEQLIKNAITYLQNVQNEDGGFPAKSKGVSDPTITSWVIMGLVASGENIKNIRWLKNSNSPLDYILLKYSNTSSTLDYSKLLMVLSAVDHGSVYKGQDISQLLLGFQQSNGQFYQPSKDEKNMINVHMWTILALTSAKAEIKNKEAALLWLKNTQNGDGGFSWIVGGASDTDDTAIAIETLLVLGEKPNESTSLTKALNYLKEHQKNDGGFSSGAVNENISNTASTAWVVQSISATGNSADNNKWMNNGENGFSYLLKNQNSDGSMNWKEGVETSKTMMTAYTLMAINNKPFPVNIEYGLIVNQKFKDIGVNHWAGKPITELANDYIISGYPDGTFRPNGDVTRAEFTTMIIKALNINLTDDLKNMKFYDVPADYWGYQYIKVALIEEIISGRSETIFDPNGNITGGELATILVNSLGGKIDRNLYVEEFDKWYEKSVAYAKSLGLLYPNFNPETNATRAECAYSISQLRKY